MATSFSISDVFISYSRQDNAFVRDLDAKLREYGQDVWVDWEDIPATADWWREIQAGIEGANTFVFIISPDSVESEVCYQEVEYAVKANKRFVPILFRDVNDPELQRKMHPSIGSHNWVFLKEDTEFETNFQHLVDVLQTDLDYVRMHTRLLVQAREWEQRGRDSSFLLSGTAVHEAEAWLAGAAGIQPLPMALHTEYIVASQRAQANRQRRMLAGVSVALAVAVGLSILSFILFQQSEANKAIAVQQAALAITNEAVAFIQSTAVANQAATSDANEDIALARGTEVAHQAATSEANAALAAANEAKALARGTEIANQAATSVANAEQAELERRRAAAIALAAQADLARAAGNQEFAILLGITAVDGNPGTWEAIRALAMALDLEFRPVNQVPHVPMRSPVSREGSIRFMVDRKISQHGVLLNTQDDSERVRLVGHTSDILGAVWNQQRLATFSADGTIRVWDTNDGRTLRNFIGHTGPVTALIWYGDNRHLATASTDGTVRIWNADVGGQPVVLTHGRDDIAQLALTRGNQQLIMITRSGQAFGWELWTTPDNLVQRAREQVSRHFTDEEAALAGLPPARSARPPAAIISCDDLMPSHLYQGVRARVTSKNNLLPLNVRDNPSVDGTKIGQIASDQTFEVLEGPSVAPIAPGLRWSMAWMLSAVGLRKAR